MEENENNTDSLIENDSMSLVYSAYTENDHYKYIAEERERDIIETAENVNKVNTIFKDLGKLVTEQQESVNDIENQINDARGNTEKGVSQLKRAELHQRKLNKCYCYLLIGGSIILLIFFLAFIIK